MAFESKPRRQTGVSFGEVSNMVRATTTSPATNRHIEDMGHEYHQIEHRHSHTQPANVSEPGSREDHGGSAARLGVDHRKRWRRAV